MSEDDIIREKIISFCRDKFLREGFARVSVDEIAADLGISKKTFYKYFSNKEDAAQQIMERIMAGVRGSIERILMDNKSAVEKLSEIISTLATSVTKLTPMMGRDIKKHLPQLWKRIEEFRRQRISDAFNRLTSQGVSEGTMRPDMNKRVFLMCVLSAIDSIMQPHVLAEESFGVSDAIREIMSIFFLGALTVEGKQQFEQLRNVQQANQA